MTFWNKLPLQVQQASTLQEFKSWLYEKHKERNILCYNGRRWASIQHNQMRIVCSKLWYDPCLKLRVLEESSCDCGEEYKDSYYYFMEYPNYAELRLELFNANIEIILYRRQRLGINEHFANIDAVHNFIIQ